MVLPVRKEQSTASPSLFQGYRFKVSTPKQSKMRASDVSSEHDYR
jgi:hypothetical protein